MVEGIVTRVLGNIVSMMSTASFIEKLRDNQNIAHAADPEPITSRISGVNYQHGHIDEVIATLASWTKDMDENGGKSKLMFPMVYLIEDIEYTKGDASEYSTVRLRLILCTSTQPKYKSAEREKYTFAPILRPLWDRLLFYIANDRHFDVAHESMIQYSYTERKFWGRQRIGEGGQKNEANVLNDYIDAIEIENLVLPLNNDCFNPINIA